tara:strand:- start:178 stop:750 length:573 start_codon:yes stop_codon:yes gene_type:complete
MLRSKKMLIIFVMLISSTLYSQDYELYTGLAVHERNDIKVGYLIGANFIIKTNQSRKYLNNIIFGFEHSGYYGAKNTMSSTNSVSNYNDDCECETNNMDISEEYSIDYRHMIRGITLNMGVEIKDNWYLISGITNYQHINTMDGKTVSEYRVNQINAGVKKFIKIGSWIWSPTITFNPNVVSFSIGMSYK